MSKLKSAKNKIVTGATNNKLTDVIKRNRRLSIVVGCLVIIVASVGIPIAILRSSAAVSGIYINPATTNVNAGDNFTVALRINPTVAVDFVTATITYDQTKLQYVSTDYTGSAFGSAFADSGGSGSVRIDRSQLGGSVTGDVLVANITFKAIAASTSTATLQLAGNATSALDSTWTNPTATSAAVNVTVPNNNPITASFTIESSTATPVVGTQFGLKVFVTSNTNIQGGQVIVTLPTGMTYQGTLDTTGTAFNPATTVTGTNGSTVNLVFATQSQTLTGKQLVATIPVIATVGGSQSITFSGQRVADLASKDITPVTANPFSISIGASIAKPVVGMPGKSQLAASENITNLKQTFSVTNFDSTATYTATMGGQTMTVSASGGFTVPITLKNGDYNLQVTVTKNGTSDSSANTIRLRSPNVNRTDCVELLDLLAVNKAYGSSSTEFDLNFDGTVSLIDLLTVTQNWGGACV